jgi:two-component system response regulator DesR
MTGDADRRIRVLFVDDTAEMRYAYEHLINGQPDMECVATMESAVGLEMAVREHRADVAVVDLVGGDPWTAIRSTADQNPRCRVITFSGHDDPATRDRALLAGSSGLVSKHDDPSALLTEIRRASSASGTEPRGLHHR